MGALVIESPGRINLIGEHTDYNEGYVLPTAIHKMIRLRFRKNNSDHLCQITSKDLGKTLNADLHKLEISQEPWENYILGVLQELQKRTDKLRGFSCTLVSDIPIGSGVSSSAALECGLAYGLNILFDLGLDKLSLVKLSQAAEHHFVGTQCGIMDQFASVMSKAGKVILLDCRSLKAEYVPLDLGDYTLLLLNSNVQHSLASSEYNTRRKECNEGVRLLQQLFPEVRSLRDVSHEMLQSLKDRTGIPELETIYNRCNYVLSENQRVLRAVEALKSGDLLQLGDLLYKSHEGLQYEYQVSCPEIDFLVDFTRAKETVLGARIMGGGFGGCSLNLIDKGAVEEFIKQIGPAYQEKFGIKLSWFLADPSGGTRMRFAN